MNPIAIFRHAPSEGPGYLAEFLDARRIPWQLFAIDAGAAVPHSAEAYSGLVFMGGPMSVNDDLPWIPSVLALIRDAAARDIPLLGHCLGGQLISKALGGVVSRNCPLPNPLIKPLAIRLDCKAAKSLVIPQAGRAQRGGRRRANESLCEIQVKEIGWGEVTVSDNASAHDWFGEIKSFQAFHWHGETFTLPPGATHLLSSAYCVNQGYAIGKHLALQCHIEMTAAMIQDWCELGAEEVAAGIASPAVQSAAKMQRQMASELPHLHEVAARLYAHWISGLRG